MEIMENKEGSQVFNGIVKRRYENGNPKSDIIIPYQNDVILLNNIPMYGKLLKNFQRCEDGKNVRVEIKVKEI